MDGQTLNKVRTDFPSSSWAIWSKEFPNGGCPEEDPDRWVKYVQTHTENLTPSIVFLSLNPAGEQPDSFRNFHSPKSKHYDDRLKAFIQENQLEALHGGYMTDLVADEVNPDSNQITTKETHVEQLLDQLKALGQDQYHVISFSGKAFERLENYFETTSHESMPYEIRSFTVTWDGITIHAYRVWFFGNWGANKEKVPELRRQLVYLNGKIQMY